MLSDEELQFFATDEETQFECIQIAPLSGNRSALLFFLSDNDYVTTYSLIFEVTDFRADSARILLATDDWLMSLTSHMFEDLLALEATTRVWDRTTEDWNRSQVAPPNMRRIWGCNTAQPFLIGTDGQTLQRDTGGIWQQIKPDLAVQLFDIHGLKSDKIYCCGDLGALQRLYPDGWRAVDLERHESFRGIDVANDGTIRLAGHDGVCLEVRNESEVIELASPATPFFSARGFQGKYYWGDAQGVFVQKGNLLEPFYDTGFAYDLRTDGTHLYCVGTDTAWRFDGAAWKNLRLIYDETTGFGLV